MSCTGSQTPLPVFQIDDPGRQAHVETLVFHLTAVLPIGLQTTDIRQRTQAKQIGCLTIEIIEVHAQTVVQKGQIQTCRPTCRSLPLQLRVTDVGHRQACRCIPHLLSHKIRTRCLAFKVVVTHKVETHIQPQIIQGTGTGHPRLIGQHPRCLY